VGFISGLNNTLSIITVHNKNETLGVLEVVPPQGPDLFKLINSTSIRAKNMPRNTDEIMKILIQTIL